MFVAEELVSVVITNYNGKKYLEDCLWSILKNNYTNCEIIIVDNASGDGSLEYIDQKFKNDNDKIIVVRLAENFGPSKARNEGVRVAHGKYIAFLDNDTKVHPDWIIEALKLFEKDEQIAALQCKLLLMEEPQKLDSVGEYLGPNGFLVQRTNVHEIDTGQYDQEVDILAAKSAGMFIRKKAFQEINGFDEDYFIFMEETDLGWRLWLAGYKTVFAPKSIVYHLFSTTRKIVGKVGNNYLVRFHGTKNYVMTLMKNLGGRNLVYILPGHIFIWNGLAFVLFFQGDFKSSRNILRAINWNFKNFFKILRKRSQIQAERKISDKDLFKKVMRRQGIWKKIKQFQAAQKTIKAAENY